MNISTEEILAELRKLVPQVEEGVTVMELAKAWGLRQSASSRRVSDLLDAGYLRHVRVIRTQRNGVTRPTDGYQLVKKGRA